MGRGRPKRPEQLHGAVRAVQLASGSWKATTEVWDAAGARRQVSRTRKSKAAATVAVREAAGAVVPVVAVVAGELHSESMIDELLDRWWERKQKSGLKGSSLQKISETLSLHVRPLVGHWKIIDATPMKLDETFQTLMEAKGTAPARQMRSTLNQALALATRWGLLDQNPVPQTEQITVARKKVKALSPTQVRAFRKFVRETSGADTEGAYIQYAEVVDLMLSSGVRIGEALALRWSRIVGLFDDTTSIIIDSTLTRVDTGLVFQEIPKTEGSAREIVVSSIGQTALRRAHNAGLPGGPYNLVFPSLGGRDNLRQPTAVRSWLSALVKGTEWEAYPGTHIFRKSVATAVAHSIDGGIEDAAKLLGHTGTDTTRRHYVERAVRAPDVSAVLDTFE